LIPVQKVFEYGCVSVVAIGRDDWLAVPMRVGASCISYLKVLGAVAKDLLD
jgi:hypothetical protein